MQQEPKIKINPDNTIIVTVSNGTAYTLREPLETFAKKPSSRQPKPQHRFSAVSAPNHS